MLDSTELNKQPPHSCCSLWLAGVALHCFLPHTSPTLAIKEEGRAGGRSVLGNSHRHLAEGPRNVRASGPEQVPSHFCGLRALVLAKERNLLGPLKPEDSSLTRAEPSMLWGWLGKPPAGSGG